MFLDFKDTKTRSVRAQWAHNHASIPLRHKINHPPDHLPPGLGSWPSPITDDEELPPAPKLKPLKDAASITNPKVAIVGTGASGLFTAMILQYLNKNVPTSAGFNASWDFYEASPSTRGVGGRLYTYNFTDTSPDTRHNYFDVGAMRFPDASGNPPSNPIMQRVFDLFATLQMPVVDFSSKAQLGSIVPYQMENDGPTGQQEYFCYNNITKWGSYKTITQTAANNDPFLMNTDNGIPKSLIVQRPSDVLNSSIAYFRDALKNLSPDQAWATLMKYDQYSTRQALMTPPPIPNPPGPPPSLNYETVQWLETFNAGTGWYDQALSETVLESLDFEFNDPPAPNQWKCILGGAQLLATKMAGQLPAIPATSFSQKVTAIRAVDTLTMQIDVSTNGASSVPVDTAYNGVFNSTTLGCLGRIDTEGANLGYTAHEAIRALSYGPSAKIGIIFNNAWWMNALNTGNPGPSDYNIATGGLGHSDLNIRTVVYPSYNSDLTEGQDAVLLCSYTWQQDALRIGSYMSSSTNVAQANADEDALGLKALLIRELARLHANEYVTEAELEGIISKSWLMHYSHDWTRDPNCSGAFAFFGPGQFANLWPGLIHPTGNLIVVGEHASPHHAWVVGALESAIYGVYSWLSLRQGDIQGAPEALSLLGKSQAGNPFVGLPPYMDQNQAAWAAIFGNLAEEKYWAKQRKKA